MISRNEIYSHIVVSRQVIYPKKMIFIVVITIMSLLFGQGTVHAEVPPAQSSFLFIGENASQYESCFAGLCNGDAASSNLNLTFTSYDTEDVLYDFYDGRGYTVPANAFTDVLDAEYDYIVLIPGENRMFTEETTAQMFWTPEICMETARMIKMYTRDMGTKVLLPLVWSDTAESDISVYAEHTYRIADALDLDCIPVGLSWVDVLNSSNDVTTAECKSSSPNEEAEYTFAATLFSYFFERSVDHTVYTHGGITPSEQESIASISFSAFTAAKTATHYSGEYISGYCHPWDTPHDVGNRNFAVMGSSTEWGTNAEMQKILAMINKSDRSYVINAYWYGYFPSNLYKPDVQNSLLNNDFDFGFGRYQVSVNESIIEKMQSYDPGGDMKFIGFNKHSTYSLSGTLSGVTYLSELIIKTRTIEDFYAIPNFYAFGRVLQDRPDITTVRLDNQHLSDVGEMLQAGLIYTLVTGETPAYLPGWDRDNKYVLALAYKMIHELGGLKKVIVPPVAYENSYLTYTNRPTKIFLEGDDLDKLPLTPSIVSGPVHGTISGNSYEYTYRPDDGFVGTDTVTFGLDNGTYLSTADITIAVEEPPPLGTVVAAINCGGGEYAATDGTVYSADTDFSGGTGYSTSDPISGTEDDPLYQTERYGNLTYSIPVVNGDYEVTLKMAEIFKTAVGQRLFDVSIEGVQTIDDLDLVAVAGHDVAHDLTFSTTVSDGALTIQITGVVDNAQMNAILVTFNESTGNAAPRVNAGTDQAIQLPTDQVSLDGTVTDDGLPEGTTVSTTWSKVSGPGTVIFGNESSIDTTATFSDTGTYVLRLTASDTELSASNDVQITVLEEPAPGAVAAAINCGGSAYTASDGTVYSADTDFSGGTPYGTSDPIAGTIDDPIYQSERYGEFTYSIPVANGDYQVTLKMAETYQTVVGTRLFGVLLEDTQVIDDLDLIAVAGHDVAYDLTFSTTVSDGALTIQLVGTPGPAKMNAILVANAVTKSPYDEWADQFGGVDVIGSATDDYDQDGISNFEEYALNGNPTHANGGGLVEFNVSGSTVSFVYASNSVDDSLTYRLIDRTNLLTGAVRTNGWDSQSFGPVNGDYVTVSNQYGTATDARFIWLEFELP